MKAVTLCLLVKDDKILLAMKKRGFGVGKWNGIGGKVQEGETVEIAAVRETEEEVGVIVDPAKIEKVGNIEFYFKDKSEWNQHMHIFLVRDWKGEPKESEEMMPKWHSQKDIPFNTMWLDDKHWLPTVLAGKKVEGKFYFANDGANIDEFDIREV
jgi:8-oxo-dGTP pyrophosphatase MutT (NUDIX family)